MFWRKNKDDAHLSLKDTIINQIEKLEKGKSLVYKLDEYYWEGLGTFVIIEQNPGYENGGKAKKYICFTERLKNGKSTGKREFLTFDKPKDISSRLAEWKAALQP
jgi:hypothetical protein